MKQFFISLFFIFAFVSCTHNTRNELTKVHLTSPNGLTQTITAKDRLPYYTKDANLNQQPYSRIVRLFGPHETEKILTTYHPNGQLFQRLECKNNQANGEYNEWSSQGELKVRAFLIGGPPELDEQAQASWIFHGFNQAFTPQGTKEAEFYYENGLLEGVGKTFHPDGSLWELFPYQKGKLQGLYLQKDPQGNVISQIQYEKGIPHGQSLKYWKTGILASREDFSEGKLMEGFYFNDAGQLIAKVNKGSGKRVFYDNEKHYFIEYQEGIEKGLVEVFSKTNHPLLRYHQDRGLKSGEEIVYHPQSHTPQIKIDWQEGMIHGKITTWYSTGKLESQREISENKKQGMLVAYYPEGDLMLLEEYQQDKLIRGQYFKKHTQTPISEVSEGKGEALIFSSSGALTKKIIYQEGWAVE